MGAYRAKPIPLALGWMAALLMACSSVVMLIPV